MNRTFRSLNNYNFRLWIGGAIVSNVGTWMQRVAQDWLVLTQLTDNNATAVGIVMALQFGPQLLLLPLTGYAADHLDRRRLIVATQIAMGLLAFGLGILTIAGMVELWHVYLFALLLGCVSAFDSPARQTFVSDLVDESDLPNAVSLNSASYSASRLVGPAVAGILIASVGTGWVFLINAASYVGVLGSLAFLRVGELHRKSGAHRARGGFAEGLRYVWQRPDLKAPLLMLFFIGTFGFNFPIFISTMSVMAFHGGSDQFGFLTTIMGIGAISGALLTARRGNPSIMVMLRGVAIFAIGCALAAITPNYGLFAITLIVIGVAAHTFNTTMHGWVQLSTEPAMRGRVVAIQLAVVMGGTPIGAPIVGWVADTYGPRWALGVGVASGLAAAIVAVHYLAKYCGLRVRFSGGRLAIRFEEQ